MDAVAVTGLFTAAQIALAMGRTKRGIQLALEKAGIASDAPTESRGQLSAGWSLERLPASWRKELAQRATSRGFRGIAHLLENPPTRFVPIDRAGNPVPIAQIMPSQLAAAERLRGVLRRALTLRDSPDAGERTRLGLEDYRREFGHVSERHWRRLYQRTIERDGGNDCFDDLALYVDAVVTPRTAAPLTGLSDTDREIYFACGQIADASRPTVRARELLWGKVCAVIAERVDAGEPEKRVRSDVARLLNDTGVALAKNEAALKETLKRKYAAWQIAARSAAAVCDGRRGRSGRKAIHVLSPAEHKQALAVITHRCGNRIDEGLREAARTGQLSEENARAILHSRQVPRAFFEEFRYLVPGQRSIHHGRRTHDLDGPHLDLDWSGVFAGDFYEGDDCTHPVYWWEERPDGSVDIIRGQWLLLIDLRSLFALSHVLIPESSYSAAHIRGLMTTGMREHGLPRRGFHFELGKWKSSKLVTGPTDVPTEVLESGFQKDFGLVFRHTHTPRAKPIERAFGHLQNRMERLPGYCGRDERRDRYERNEKLLRDVRAGRVPADQRLFSKEEMLAALCAILDDYNRTPQRGKMLAGMSPLEGWLKLQKPNDPLPKFDLRCAYLLSHVRTGLVAIQQDGLRFKLGGKSYAFFDQQTGARVGQRVRVYLNPDEPDLAFCEPENGDEIFAVQRSYGLPAMDATPEQFEREKGLVNAHLGYQRALYNATANLLPESAYRPTAVDRRTSERAAQIAEQSAKAEDGARQSRNAQARVSRASRAAGIPERLVSTDAELAPEVTAACAELEALNAEVRKSGEISLPNLNPNSR